MAGDTSFHDVPFSGMVRELRLVPDVHTFDSAEELGTLLVQLADAGLDRTWDATGIGAECCELFERIHNVGTELRRR